MDAAKVEPPQKKKRTNPTDQPSLPVSFSSLPDEIVLSCLARISKYHYRSLALVSKRFHSLLSSREIFVIRSQIGTAEPCLYVSMWLPTDHRWFTLLDPDQTLITNGEIKGELRLEPVTLSSRYSPVRLSTSIVAVGSEFYQIGGPDHGKRSRAVRVFDCRSHTWRRAPNMRVARVHAKSYFLDGKIYVMGGCGRREDSNWCEVFDLKIHTWKPLPSPIDNDFKGYHNGVVFQGRLHVITEQHNYYAYDPKERRWNKEPIKLFGLFYRLSRERLGPFCVIEDVLFDEYRGEYWWWHVSCNGMVRGLSDLYRKRARHNCRTIQLVNSGGKLVIMWEGWTHQGRQNDIWCAVIRLEKRCSDELAIFGEIERLNIVCTVPKSYNNYTCLSVLL